VELWRLEIANALRLADNNPNIIGTVLLWILPAVSAASPFVQFEKTKTKPVVGIETSWFFRILGMCAVQTIKWQIIYRHPLVLLERCLMQTDGNIWNP
jgi:hypothetical protein